MPLNLDPAQPAYAAACCGAKVLDFAPGSGSRRRRLWDLDASTHCPVLGVCLPLDVLRRLVAKALPGPPEADDYGLHCLAVQESRRRAGLSELVHKELERRFAAAVRQTAPVKCVQALGRWWSEQRHGEQMPGALWAVLSHAHVDTVLENRVLADVHMLQHQRGAAQRVDIARHEALLVENAALCQEIQQLQQRSHQQAAALQGRLERLQARAIQERALAIGRDTALAALRDDLQSLHAQAPGLPRRAELARQVQTQAERIVELERALSRSRPDALRAATPADLPTPVAAAEAPVEAAAAAPPLGDRAVLCVGGRPASVPLYRHIVERCGGRFLHHDGGEEHGAQRLDATLSAADVVICQTGCISHDAYWRVKDHCKRHRKRCVFVENPGSASLKRALAELRT
jgi:hypothetical protein